MAERRSTVRSDDGGLVEAVALWVHLDPVGARPRPMPEGFEAVYGPSAAGRHVRARLRHRGEPPADGQSAPWRFRAADLDLADHVNNAVYWQALEEDLVGDGAREPFDAEIEHRAPADVGEAALVRDGEMLWITAADGVVLASWPLRVAHRSEPKLARAHSSLPAPIGPGAQNEGELAHRVKVCQEPPESRICSPSSSPSSPSSPPSPCSWGNGVGAHDLVLFGVMYLTRIRGDRRLPPPAHPSLVRDQ